MFNSLMTPIQQRLPASVVNIYYLFINQICEYRLRNSRRNDHEVM